MFRIGLSFSVFTFIIRKFFKSMLFTDFVRYGLYIFFPIAVYIPVFISINSANRIKNYMPVHMLLVIMDCKNIIISRKICFTKLFYNVIRFCFITFSRTKRYYKMISLPPLQFLKFSFCVHHGIINFRCS